MLALMQTPEEYDARSLRSAMKVGGPVQPKQRHRPSPYAAHTCPSSHPQGAGTDEAVISEILASRSNGQLQKIKAKYSELFSRDLEKDIKSETSGHLERIYVSLLAVREGGHCAGPRAALLLLTRPPLDQHTGRTRRVGQD